MKIIKKLNKIFLTQENNYLTKLLKDTMELAIIVYESFRDCISHFQV